jgi:hypothetical protein
LGKIFVKTLLEWGVDKNHIVAVTIKNRANIKKTKIDKCGEKQHLVCLVLTINLIVKKNIEKTQDENAITKVKTGGFLQLLHKVRCIVKYFKKSTKACDELRSIQKSKGNK